MMRPLQKGRGVVVLLLLLLAAGSSWLYRELRLLHATVEVDTDQVLAEVPAGALGVNTAAWDPHLLDPAVENRLRQAGIGTLRFPGGSFADVYHWQTHSLTEGVPSSVAPGDTFDAVASLARKVRAGLVVTVNYGSNALGTGGGDPAEAAAWVQYANVAQHQGVQYWEIGNEVYGSGFYGARWEEDLHSGHSPADYAHNALEFIRQMKTVDPSIRVGIPLTTSGIWPDGQSPDWNSSVLRILGRDIDFVSIHWYPEAPSQESDDRLLASPRQVPQVARRLRSLLNQYCGSNASRVQILVTETNASFERPGPQSVQPVNAFFLADDLITWLESGAGMTLWWDLHNGITPLNQGGTAGTRNYGDYGLLSSGGSAGDLHEPPAETPFPTYYAMQILGQVVPAGSKLVSARSDLPQVVAHAARQPGGGLAVLLLNEDPERSCRVKLSLPHFSPGRRVQVTSYAPGSSADPDHAVPETTEETSGAGDLTHLLPPQSLTVLTLTPDTADEPQSARDHPPTSPANAANPAPSSIAANPPASPAAPSPAAANPPVAPSASSPGGEHNPGSNRQPPAAKESAPFSFENGLQGWTSTGSMVCGVSPSSDRAYAGKSSLAISINASHSESEQVYVDSPAAPAGAAIRFHVWIPPGSAADGIQPFVQAGNWSWTGTYQPASALKTGAWNELSVNVPRDAVVPLHRIGLQISVSRAWSGTLYLDSVGW